tara:strand:- start:9247 stop:9720 length:474 start_codon:yes stop_codon:yes gene_type:complete
MDESSKQIFWSVTAGIIVSAFFLTPTVEPVEYIKEPTPLILATSTSQVKVEIEVAPEIPVQLQKIAWCESRNRQFYNGDVLRGRVNPDDVGKWQINEYYHLAESIRLGMDIHTLEGNTEYALHLYSNEGSTPWNWSRPCWGDPNRVWWSEDGMMWSE